MELIGSELKKNLSVTLTIVAIVFGVLLGIGFETQKNVDSEQLARQAQLEESIALSQNRIESLKTKQKELTGQLEAARQEVIQDPVKQVQMSQYSVMDGTSAVRGPGIRITIDDKGEGVEKGRLIETRDLRMIINALRSAGAEALSVNGQRIVSTSEIVMSGEDRILINQVPVSKKGSSSYEILAIGNQDDLWKNMEYEMSDLRESGMKVEAVREVVMVPSYKRGYQSIYGSSQTEAGEEPTEGT